MIVFLAAQAPELVSRDLRSHVLPLYFARPISRLDYPLAKLAAFILACLAMIEIPLLHPLPGHDRPGARRQRDLERRPRR